MPSSSSHILVYGGHLTDAPDRPEARFPEAKAKAVRRWIDAHLERWRAGPGWLAIGGAARGADLLIVEACLARGMDVAMHLALPVDEYRARSVRGGDPEAEWEERFRRLVEAHGARVQVLIMPEGIARPDEHVFEASNRWIAESARARGPRAAIHALAVWDERPGTGGPGGTADLVDRMREFEVTIVNPLLLDTDPYALRRHRLAAPGPKRILALDGGGMRGALTLGFLARIESLLRARTRRPDFVLRDYFDLIGGTSTGAILATGLAIGMTTDELIALYHELGPKIFGRRRRRIRFWRSRFSHAGLSEALSERLGDRRLDDPSIACGLCIIAKRADTRSTWPLHNHPDARYAPRNGRILLRHAVRASTAAPTYFEPERVEYEVDDDGHPVAGAFVDGGVSMMNNPALQLLLLATCSGFRFDWPLGTDKLLLVSVGTGRWETHDTVDDVMSGRRGWRRRLLRSRALWDWAVEVPSMLMDDASALAETILQLISDSPTAVQIDREIGDLANEWPSERRVLTYLRYNAELSDESRSRLGVPDHGIGTERLRRLDADDTADALFAIGSAAAATMVLPEHFGAEFDAGSGEERDGRG